MDRPIGVSIISVLHWIYGVTYLAFSLGYLIVMLLTHERTYYLTPDITGQVLTGVAYVVVGYGLWRLTPWSFWGAIGLASLQLVTIFLELSGVFWGVFGMRNDGALIIINSAIILYLILKKPFFEGEPDFQS